MRSPVALCGTILAAVFVISAVPRANAQQIMVPAPVASLVSQGDKYMAQRDYVKALDSYQKAEKASHHNCSECLLREVKVYKTAGDFNTALDCAKKAEKEAGDNKTEMANALLTHANLLAAMSSKPKDKKLAEAVSDTRQALTLNPDQTIAHFNLGVLLMKQEQDADGAAELKAYLASNNTDPATVKSAREDIADPRRAREPYAPEFSFNTLENQQVSLASLHGKVALLDFWGSWCPPCRASIPTIANLQKDFAKKHTDVEFVGISSDDDANAWQKFIAANRMVWPEYLDLDGHVQQAFGIDSYPTYIVLDRNGVIRFRQSGFDEQSSGAELSEALDKALKVKLEAPAPTAVTSATSDSAASPAQAPASTSNAAAQPSSAPAATSAYGNPEPTYIKGPSYNAAAGSNAAAPTASAKGSFFVSVLIQPNSGDGARSYAASIAQAVKNRWLAALPQEAQAGQAGVVLVQLEIGHDGKLADDAEIMKSSGSDALDHSALAAVSAAAPFATPPGSSDSTFEMQIMFICNESLTDAVHSLAAGDPQ